MEPLRRPDDPDLFARWLEEARAGSPAALGRAFEFCRRILLYRARQYLPDGLAVKQSPSELVQDTYLEAQVSITQFTGKTVDDFVAWLTTILRNNAADLGRKFHPGGMRDPGRERPLDDGRRGGDLRERLADRGASPSSAAGHQEKVEAVRRALGRLPEVYRRVIEWHEFEGRSTAEIAAGLGCTPGAARQLWQRAFRRLAAELKKDGVTLD